MIVPDLYHIQFNYQTLAADGQVKALNWVTRLVAPDAPVALLQALINFRQEVNDAQIQVWGLKTDVSLVNDITRQALEKLLL